MLRPAASIGACVVAGLVLLTCQRAEPAEAEARGMRSAAELVDGAQAGAQPPLEIAPEIIVSQDGGSGDEPPKEYVLVTPRTTSSPEYGNVVLLFDQAGETVVPIFIGGTEALSIQLRLEKRRFTRPLTHDLLDEMVAKMGAKMLRAQVDMLQGNVYIGTVVMKRADELLKFDARPSDAIALAIGNKAPIYISKKLLAEAGIRPGDIDREKPDPKADPVAL